MTESELNEANPDAYDSFGVIQTGLLIKQQQTWRKLGEEKKKTKEKRLLIAGTAVLDPTIRRSCVECVMRFRRRLERSTSKSGRCVRSHGVVYLASMIGVEKKWTVPGSSSGSLPLPLPLPLSLSLSLFLLLTSIAEGFVWKHVGIYFDEPSFVLLPFQSWSMAEWGNR